MITLLTILGCTATGKTKLAAALAYRLDGEIISADSRQVYLGMDIGTGKDTGEYTVAGKRIPYHLIDVAEPGSEYNLFSFQNGFVKAYREIHSKGKIPVLCGGTGLYLDAVLRQYELIRVPEDKRLRSQLQNAKLSEITERLKKYGPLHNTTDLLDKKRAIRALEIARFRKRFPGQSIDMPDVLSLNFGIAFDRETIRERITRRLKDRLENGLVEEVRQLLDSGLSEEQLTFYGLEYRYVTYYVAGKISFDEMFSKLNTAIHQFAKRQSTWFRRMEKKGVLIHWIDGKSSLDDKLEVIFGHLETESPRILQSKRD
ncbi:MAG: tRNA (adenosine(37)-N6)-dimethylallyltransferase MiaA [bacterium]|jgi:tRNA dimethylallyltransferase